MINCGQMYSKTSYHHAILISDYCRDHSVERYFIVIYRESFTVKLIYSSHGTEGVLATRVDIATSILKKGLGLMFRRNIPNDYALVFPFDSVKTRRLHMVFVPFDIDAVWLQDGTVIQSKRLTAWTGYGKEKADMVIELPAGTASDLPKGAEIRIKESP